MSNSSTPYQQESSTLTSFSHSALAYATAYPVLHYTLLTIGAIWLTVQVFQFLHSLYVFLFRKEMNLIKRYGENSWAVVTGASDGIGKAFCFRLADHGFNVVLVARNKDKLEGVSSEIVAKSPNCKTKVVVADFSKSTEEGFFDKIVEQLQGLDISFLVNNVGGGEMDHFLSRSVENIRNEIIVNCIPMAILSRKIIPLMTERKSRSAIINLSSIAGVRPLPRFAVYCSTKVFNDFFSRSLAFEFKDKIDILSLKPMYVSSALNKNEPGGITLSGQECVDGCFKDLGREWTTHGHYKHKLVAYITSLLPTWLLDRAGSSQGLKIIEKSRAEKKKGQ